MIFELGKGFSVMLDFVGTCFPKGGRICGLSRNEEEFEARAIPGPKFFNNNKFIQIILLGIFLVKWYQQ